MRTLGLILILAGAALACNAPTSPPVTALPPGSLAATDPPMSTQPPVPTAAPPQQEPQPTPLSIAPLATARLMETVNALAAIDTRHVNSVGARTAADQIAEGFASAGYTPERQTFPAVVNEQYTDQENVIARLPGQSDEIVVVGAHYDSRTVDPFDAAGRAPGAGDNASGAAALLEIARVLAGTTPRHTIVFVAFAGEEVGMLGSRYFVSQTDPAAIRAMFALDSIGGVAAPQDAIRVFSPPPAGSESRWLAHRVALAAGPQTLDVLVQPTIDRPGRYSDHVPFVEAGVPSVRFIDALEDPNNHTAFDTPDRVSADYLERATRLALQSVLALAYGPQAPPRPTLIDITVQWEPVPGAERYIVALYREDEPLETVTVSGVTQITGEVFLGADAIAVAAVDADGLAGAFSPPLILFLLFLGR